MWVKPDNANGGFALYSFSDLSDALISKPAAQLDRLHAVRSQINGCPDGFIISPDTDDT